MVAMPWGERQALSRRIRATVFHEVSDGVALGSGRHPPQLRHQTHPRHRHRRDQQRRFIGHPVVPLSAQRLLNLHPVRNLDFAGGE